MPALKTFTLSLSILTLTGLVTCQKENVNHTFEAINLDLIKYNKLAAEIAWESSINPDDPKLPEKAASYQRNRITWQHQTCARLAALQYVQSFNDTQKRQTRLLCRGPAYTFQEARYTSDLYEVLQNIYNNAEVCIPTTKTVSKSNVTEIEEAILNYISTVEEHLNPDWLESTEIAAKLAVNNKNGKGFCLKGEPDFETVFHVSRNEKVLRWLWLVWREAVGPPMKEPYLKFVRVENIASRRNDWRPIPTLTIPRMNAQRPKWICQTSDFRVVNSNTYLATQTNTFPGYTDIGAAWRDELEIPDLRRYCRRLYSAVEPLYKLLHGVMRYYLRKQYGDIVPERGAIPAHLLGNLWAQDWQPLEYLILPSDIDIDRNIKKMNWTVNHMVKRAEDFYQSLGHPPMTDAFWRHSVFARQNNSTRCHGTAADMFQDGDFRLLYCAGTTAADLYVIHHEMGHIHYYMAYEKQPGIYRGANTALHESIGDAIMFGVLTPQHLHRLGLINDSLLYTDVHFAERDLLHEDAVTHPETENGETADRIGRNVERLDGKDTKKAPDEIVFTADDVLLLKTALNKLPQIPFSLLIDEYRWKYFERSLNPQFVNEEFWAQAFQLQGIAPISRRGEEYFDIGAMFHVPDNTPYVRYFLSSFYQYQLFEDLCRAAVYGRRNVQEDIPPSIPLHRCDIYGSKAAGELLMDIMSRGNSKRWREILQDAVGYNDITPEPLIRYYRPLHRLLNKLVRKHGIPIGW